MGRISSAVPERRAAAVFALAVVCALAAFARGAAADTPKRVTPDYGGRRSRPPPTPGEVLLWVPRVILFPAYVVSEFVLRRPLGALVTTAERNHWATALIDIFTFDAEHKSGLVPTAFFDFGLQPSVGLYFFWNDAIAAGHDLRARVSYFGSSWLAVGASERLHVGKAALVALDARWVRRPDNLYFGEGPQTLRANASRFLSMTLDVGPHAEIAVAPGWSYRARAGVRTVDFRDRGFGGDRSIDDAARAGAFAVPGAYHPGYTELYERMEVAADSRPGEDAAQTGVRAAGHVEHGTNVRASPASSWLAYGAAAGAFLDVWKHRVLGISLSAEWVDPLRGGPVPFTEETVWGGVEPLTGFLPGRLHGRSAASAKVTYTWPIWVWLDGRMSAAVGNVFDAGLRDFNVNLLRASAGLGVQSTGSPDHRLELLVGIGTETFAQGGSVDSFRLVVGGTSGF